MSKIAIVYGSTTGNTESAAQKLQTALAGAELFNVADVSMKELGSYDLILLGTSTWGVGDLQDDWDGAIGDLSSLDLSGKKLAFFGTGDQESYGDSFVDGIGALYDAALAAGGECIAQVSADGYSFEESQAFRDGKFVGLPLDMDNQDDETDRRIAEWVEQLKNEL